MNNFLRTDLACEFGQVTDPAVLPEGTEFSSESISGFGIERMRLNESAGKRLGKPAGNYITVNCGHIWEIEDEHRFDLVLLLSSELRKMALELTGKKADGNFSILVAGLGNAEMTPDSIGPGTVSRITVTHHLSVLKPSVFDSLGCCRVSATSPGVLGQTGIEAADLIYGAVKAAKPDLVVAVDALAARSCDRLASTVQISDTGIFPGSGIGNRRGSICRQTLNVPVIALGVPTVIDSSTLVYDALEQAGVRDISDGLTRVLENGRKFIVAPKECDIIAKQVSRLLANSIDTAFGINLDDGT